MCFGPRVHVLLMIALAGEKAGRLSGLGLFVFMHPFFMPVQHGLGFLLRSAGIGFNGL